MSPGQQQAPGVTNINTLHDQMCNVVYNVCSIITTPPEMLLRPRYGSRYFPPIIQALSTLLMMFLPLLSGLAGMIPFSHTPPPRGLIGMGDLTRYYFLGGLVHGIRVWRRMIHMEREQHSQYEGPALPIFHLFPKGNSFWVCRIVWEPVFLFTASVLLQSLYILQPPAATYLQVAAFALAMKQYVAWYQQWQYLRQIMDARVTAPILAKLAENKASDAELESAHLASFPKDMPADVRRGAVVHLARIFLPEDQPPPIPVSRIENPSEER